MPEEPTQDSADENASRSHSAKKGDGNAQGNLPSVDSGLFGKAGLLMLDLVSGGSVATGFWLYGDRLVHNGFPLLGSLVTFFAFILYFATAATGANIYWPHPQIIWGIFIAFCFSLSFPFFRSSQPPLNSVGQITGSLSKASPPIQATPTPTPDDERAWINPPVITANVAVGKPFMANVHFDNTGQTLAKQVHAFQTIDIFPSGAHADFTWDNIFFKITSSPGSIVGAGQGFDVYPGKPPTSNPSRSFSQMEIDDIQSGKRRLYVCGKVQYCDAHGFRQWLTYSQFYDPSTSTFADDTIGNDTGTIPASTSDAAPAFKLEAVKDDGSIQDIKPHSTITLDAFGGFGPPCLSLKIVSNIGPATNLTVAMLASITGTNDTGAVSAPPIPWAIDEPPFSSGWLIWPPNPLPIDPKVPLTTLFNKKLTGDSFLAEFVAFSDGTDSIKIPVTIKLP